VFSLISLYLIFRDFFTFPSGISLTPSKERAEDYAINPGGYRSEEISSDIPTVYEVSPNEIKNPLIFRQDNTESSPAIELLEKLGTPSEKASNIVEKAYEEKGGQLRLHE